MDHLPLPSDDFAHPPIEIPYLCNNGYMYDDLGFLTYPDRAGIDIHKLRDNNLDLQELQDLAPFLQAWLWFGLLGETLQVGSRENRDQRIASTKESFTYTRDGRPFISAKEIYKIVRRVREKNRAPLYNEWHQTRVYACLQVAMDFVGIILSTPSCQSLLAENIRFVDLPDFCIVLLSIQILVNTLFSLRSILFVNPRTRLYRSIGNVCPGNVLVDLILKQSGWCPFDISRLPSDVRFKYYLSFFNQFDSSESHLFCRSDQCLRTTLEEELIRPVHTHSSCSCETITISPMDVENAVQGGMAPLFTFHQYSSGKGRLDLRSVSLDGAVSFPYVAISHVRSTGLGNFLQNSLPYCQLTLLQILVNQVCPSQTTPVPFWIDTIGLPVDCTSRKPALRSIRPIFQQAKKILVLDPALFHHAVASEQEALIRIRYSAWKKRLWTLQEGALAQSLLPLRQPDLVARRAAKGP
jgi:hypothetical protein